MVNMQLTKSQLSLIRQSLLLNILTTQHDSKKNKSKLDVGYVNRLRLLLKRVDDEIKMC